MAMSKAKKLRNKIEREGNRNPEEMRYRNVGLVTRVKADKTKYKRKGRNASDYSNQHDSALLSAS